MHKYELLYTGLQSGGSAFILSAALGQAARHVFMLHRQPDLTAWTLALTWLLLGILCIAPAIWACKRRIDGMLGRPHGFRLDSPADVWTCRRAAAVSLFATLSWWFAPALMQMR